MKKILVATLIVAALFTGTITVKAVENSWIVKPSNSSITGTLYRLNNRDDQASSKTVNHSHYSNYTGSYVQVYAYNYDYTIDQSSVSTKGSDSQSIYTETNSYDPIIWESQHSTRSLADKYYGLQLRL